MQAIPLFFFHPAQPPSVESLLAVYQVGETLTFVLSKRFDGQALDNKGWEQWSDFEHLQIGSNCTCLIVENFILILLLKNVNVWIKNKGLRASEYSSVLVNVIGIYLIYKS